MIPIWVLWQVQLKPTQKFGFALFLCLSICMIIMATIRVSRLRYKGEIDSSWIFLWQQAEACTAVTMLSLTAFRSVFVGPKPGFNNNNKASPWVPSTRRLIGRHNKSRAVDQPRLDDITIPSAALTGMSRFMNRNEAAQNSIEESLTSYSVCLV